MNYTNKGHIRNCDNAKLASMLADCERLSDSLMVGRIRHELKARTKSVPLYSLGSDVFTTKAPECGECGFTVRKDGTCGFCGC